jgi:hypothetical protein
LTHFDFFAINFTVWTHILSIVGDAVTRQQGYGNMVQSWKGIAYWSLLLLELSPSEKSAQEPEMWIAITHWILTPLGVTKEAKIFRLTCRLIDWTLKIMVHFYHFHYSFEILTNVLNLITQLTIGLAHLMMLNCK